MNKLIIAILAIMTVGGGAFYGGMKYVENKNPAGENRSPRFQELGANFSGAFGRDHEGGRAGFREGGSRPLIGEVISQSDDSLTIKLSDGSTKIVFINQSTEITKFVNSALSDLAAGQQIFVGGLENPDGSYTAQTIQLRPLNNN